MGCGILFVHIVRIARAFSGNENRSGLITSEREVGRISRFCIERALREHARMSVVGLGRFGDGLVSSHIPKLPHHSHAAISKITCVIPTLSAPRRCVGGQTLSGLSRMAAIRWPNPVLDVLRRRVIVGTQVFDFTPCVRSSASGGLRIVLANRGFYRKVSYIPRYPARTPRGILSPRCAR
jgi:hypothetical protein